MDDCIDCTNETTDERRAAHPQPKSLTAETPSTRRSSLGAHASSVLRVSNARYAGCARSQDNAEKNPCQDAKNFHVSYYRWTQIRVHPCLSVVSFILWVPARLRQVIRENPWRALHRRFFPQRELAENEIPGRYFVPFRLS